MSLGKQVYEETHEECLSLVTAIDSLSRVTFRDDKVNDRLEEIITDLNAMFSSL
ncbi:hypothetical protein HZI73_26115 (plasmid) [Vallitalea pronyensis]|uniref:Uncharacterized protein n=1 Tax=Vallitalea pronyensis TaxID=1348613 RepID=A0A8J8MQ43_9FIRM|nr:hypothetical protein [Vallitalea pronyensis]QUI25890.1 hypothetical protein HZI73_26115 [Vallitalea pronyensis]